MVDDIVRLDEYPEDEVTQLLRSALAAEAAQVVPQDRFADLLDQIERVENHEPEPHRASRLRWLSVAAALALAVGLAVPLVLGRLAESGRDPATAATPNTSGVTAPAPTAQSSLPTTQRRLPVYYLGADGLLYREFRDLPTQHDRLTTSVAAVLNVAPLDPGYRSAWAGGQVNSATLEGNLVTLDLSGSAFKEFTNRETAELAVQQVVYTAIAAVGDRNGAKAVRILMDGSPQLPVLGTPGADFVRSGNDPLAPVWVTIPETGQSLPAGTVMLSGYQQVDVPDPVLHWTLTRDGESTPMAQGEVTASGNDAGWRSWQVKASLTPGEHQFTIRQAAGGESLVKTFTVTG